MDLQLCIGDFYELTIKNGIEAYVFRYDDSHRADTLRAISRFATDSKHPRFTWIDVSILSRKIIQEAEKMSRNRFLHPAIRNDITEVLMMAKEPPYCNFTYI